MANASPRIRTYRHKTERCTRMLFRAWLPPGAHIRIACRQFDLTGHGRPITGDNHVRICTLQGDSPPSGTERNAHCPDQGIKAQLEVLPGLNAKNQLFCSQFQFRPQLCASSL